MEGHRDAPRGGLGCAPFTAWEGARAQREAEGRAPGRNGPAAPVWPSRQDAPAGMVGEMRTSEAGKAQGVNAASASIALGSPSLRSPLSELSAPSDERESRASDGGAGGGERGAAIADREAAARERLAEQYGLTSAFIGVGMLARILGIAPATIYGHMRSGRFFLPYRLFNASPMVCVDDLARWYCGDDGVVPAFGAKPQKKPSWARDDQEDAEVPGRGLTRAEAEARIDMAEAAARRGLGLEPPKKRRKRTP